MEPLHLYSLNNSSTPYGLGLCGCGRPSDLHEAGRTTNCKNDSLLDSYSDHVLDEVILILVRKLKTLALIVADNRTTDAESTNKCSTLCHSRCLNGTESPEIRLARNCAIAVSTCDESATIILAILVFSENDVVIVVWIDDDRICGESRILLNQRDCSLDSVRSQSATGSDSACSTECGNEVILNS